MRPSTIFDELARVKQMVGILVARSTLTIKAEGKIVDRGRKALVRLEELIVDLDPEGVK